MMKRILVLTACIVLGSAMLASAASFNSWLSYTRTANASGTGYDLLQLSMSADPLGAGNTLQILEGTWSVSGGSMYLYSNSTYWKNRTLVDYSEDPPLSVIMFDAQTGLSRVGSGNLYSSMSGTWYTGDDELKKSSGDVVAMIYVTPGAELTYDGVANFDMGTYGQTINASGSTLPVPEPGTLVLLATGLIGLLAWVRRRCR